MKNMAILRISKIKGTRELRGALAHNLRLQDTPNADPSRLHLNLQPKSLAGIDQCLAKFDSAVGQLKIRKNAVLAHEVLVTGSPEHMATLNRKQQIEYFKSAQSYLTELHGGNQNLVSMSVHFDESNPHCHFIFTPVIDKKLNSRLIIGGHRNRMSELQSEFAEVVGSKHGFVRGVKNSKATHRDLRDLKQLEVDNVKLRSEVEGLRSEVSTLKNELENLSKRFIEPLITVLRDSVDRTPTAIRRALERFDSGRDEMKSVVSAQVMKQLDDSVEPLRPRMR